MTSELPRILLVDSYDSFTYNLASLCRKAIPNSQVHIIKNDDINLADLQSYLPYFSAVIVGPGPGSPDVPEDVGLVRDLWNLDDPHLLPVFGVCLGLQSLALEHGATLRRLSVVKHGQVSTVEHTGTDIFKGVGPVDAVRYHSLHVELSGAKNIEELASTHDVENGKVVMAIRHATRPFWAVQYHPESVLTRGGGIEIMLNFWRLACAWSSSHGRVTRPWDQMADGVFGTPWPYIRPPPSTPRTNTPLASSTIKLSIPGLSAPDICEVLGVDDDSSPFVMLESAAQPGRFTIIGCLTSASLRVTYSIGDSFIHLANGESCDQIDLGSHDVWSWLTSFMNKRKVIGGSPEIPFWGGLIGYLSYELGVESLRVSRERIHTEARHPDVNLVFVERSIVLDSTSGNIYLQSIMEDDDEWLTEMVVQLHSAARNYSTYSSFNTSPSSTKARPNTSTVILPDRDHYRSRINMAKEYLFAGESYELCLTANTRITLNDPLAPKASSTYSPSWQRYKHLRELNPAPHAAYLRLHPTTLLASSPERFLSFSRSPGATYQLRPIKGTVRKGPNITRAVAEKALRGSRKEVAENLMIVDLIRHDLHGAVGENVEVKQFCTVEEYKTVWQLVSVIEGKPADDADQAASHYANGALGWEVLRRSLPPGSMTGAPKKRSVEILRQLEDEERNVYSGVFGYWCAGGGGDWSVTIRSCFKYDDRYECDAHSWTKFNNPDFYPGVHEPEHWVIGAGGAITALSDPDAEWDEMLAKLQSVLRVFGAAVPRGH
ncbi:para-aminobenzoate synthase [Rhizopogon vinicolor AM-OR11-026]|uniref:aminodeoxychorismate synthase n=1 Tax=Rhizopogon vinicolor AM-OR11-026 TaxID=1314800 RepID=A0A1B7NDQ2_9AGAM|nr:para-aminobenzoate synthase [Rhizopogon vinicolor AM-OR11-026]